MFPFQPIQVCLWSLRIIHNSKTVTFWNKPKTTLLHYHILRHTPTQIFLELLEQAENDLLHHNFLLTAYFENLPLNPQIFKCNHSNFAHLFLSTAGLFFLQNAVSLRVHIEFYLLPIKNQPPLPFQVL